ncbi:hypothetical protein KUV89_13135 [Marinobacter hydrocarbonoclasticus]|nr:hypothetical protein [Marinobacter nauticus]
MTFRDYLSLFIVAGVVTAPPLAIITVVMLHLELELAVGQIVTIAGYTLLGNLLYPPVLGILAFPAWRWWQNRTTRR